MPRDVYDRLIKFYEFMLGPLPGPDEFKRVLQDTVAPDDLEAFFLLPFAGHAPLQKLALKSGQPESELKARYERLACEGLILIYTTDGETVYERGNPVFMTEQQVRKPEDTPRRAFYARFFNRILSGEVSIAAPTKTPYYRVLPVQPAITQAEVAGQRRVIPVNVEVPDPRAVLPIDIVSEMIRRDARYIAVAECYCRRTKRLVGEGCDHPLETCLVFNKVAETLVEHGTAHRIDYEEAMRIIWEAEAAGLVHNVDNCEGKIGSVCNCCSCCSILLTSWKHGMRNTDSASRYLSAVDAGRCMLCRACLSRCPTSARSECDGRLVVDDELCLGCGLCVTACPQGANQMRLRERHVRLPTTADALYSKIGREAIIGIARQRIARALRR